MDGNIQERCEVVNGEEVFVYIRRNTIIRTENILQDGSQSRCLPELTDSLSCLMAM